MFQIFFTTLNESSGAIVFRPLYLEILTPEVDEPIILTSKSISFAYLLFLDSSTLYFSLLFLELFSFLSFSFFSAANFLALAILVLRCFSNSSFF